MSTLSRVPTHGNYHGYYHKRPFLDDERLTSLPPDLFRGARVLDIGCNEGWVTCEIAQSFGARFVVGVDIDDTLVSGAWRRRRAVWSRQCPQASPKQTEVERGDASLSNKRRKLQSSNYEDSVDVNATMTVRNYFPASCEHEFGSLPIPPSSNRGKDVFPHNVCFRTADWTKTSIPEDAGGYDVVIGFSISKWIHLNDGDEGLKRLFSRIYEVLNVGGIFVLEAQPWESYSKAKRMNEELKRKAKEITIRPKDFKRLLSELGFRPREPFGTVGKGGFSRPIDLYVKI